MNEKINQNHNRYTIVGTNIDEVKRLNAQSGLSYNEVMELLARTTARQGTGIYSDTNLEEVKRMNQQNMNNK